MLLYQVNFSFLNTYEWCFFSIVYSFSEYLLLRFQWCIQELTLNMNPFKLIKATYLNQTHSFCHNICNLVTMTISGRVHIIYNNICNVIISSKPNIFFRKHKISYLNYSYNIIIFLSQTLKNENTCVEMECLLTLHFTYLIVIWLPQCEQ